MSPSEIPSDYEELKENYIDIYGKYYKVQKELEWYRKQMFGTKSEKSPPPDPNQLSLIEEPVEPKKEAEQTQVNSFVRAKPGKKPLPKHLPRKQVVHPPQEVLGKEDEYVKIGEDIYEELNFIPALFEIIEHVYPKYKKKDLVDAPILQAPAVYRPIEKGRP